MARTKIVRIIIEGGVVGVRRMRILEGGGSYRREGAGGVEVLRVESRELLVAESGWVAVFHLPRNRAVKVYNVDSLELDDDKVLKHIVV